jgi:hypothetical protein
VRSFRDALTLLVLLLLVLSVRVAPLGETAETLIPEANAADRAPVSSTAPDHSTEPAPKTEPVPTTVPAQLDLSIVPGTFDPALSLGVEGSRRAAEHRCRMVEASIRSGAEGEERVIFVLEIDADGTGEVRTESIVTDEPRAWIPGRSC